MATAIGKALTTLSARDRSAVLMREVQGMSYNEIAGVLNVPLGTLKAVLHRKIGLLGRLTTIAVLMHILSGRRQYHPVPECQEYGCVWQFLLAHNILYLNNICIEGRREFFLAA